MAHAAAMTVRTAGFRSPIVLIRYGAIFAVGTAACIHLNLSLIAGNGRRRMSGG